MFSVVFGEGWMLTSSQAFRPNFYKSADLNFSYFLNVEGFFFSGRGSVLQSIFLRDLLDRRYTQDVQG